MSRTAQIGPALVAAASAQGQCTLREMAMAAQVGWDSARHMVPKLVGAQQLQVVGERRVDYRNRPVAVYAPVAPVADVLPATVHGPDDEGDGMSTAEIQLFMQGWPG